MKPPAKGSDVVVVGGGLVGTSMAYELVAAGADTILIDRHDPGRATDAGAGILSPETGLDPDPVLFAFAMAAAQHYPALAERLAGDGATESGFAVTGSLLVAERPGDDQVMETAVGLVQQRCPGLVEEIGPPEASRHFPPLGQVRRALYNPVGRRVDGRALNAALRSAALSRGLRVMDADVTGLDADRARGSVDGVLTGDGTVAAGAVVVCGGAWSAPLADALDAPLPVRPLKGQIVHLVLPSVDIRAWSIVQPVLGFYLVPWPDGRVACGGTMEASAGYDCRPTADGVHQLLRECLRTAPGLAQATLADVRVGLRPSCVDGRPVLGRVPGWANAYVATGHGAEGLLLGPLSARLVARQVLDAGPLVDRPGDELAHQVLEYCAPDRFVGMAPV
ncbi:MAG TPA: FAD-dependent oxidoreductase [Acidimicrobiales bacterium]|jgi:D-amino-acid dehydrogenase|nr:FAD-dependent oxidoreductase [Acidimicrobiales bacterium]